MHDLAFALAGFAAGLIAGFGGARAHLSMPRISGTHMACAMALALVAGLGHAPPGSTDWSLLAQWMTGSLAGFWLGPRLATRTPERLTRSALSARWPGQAPNRY